MQNSECRIQNCFVTFYSTHKEECYALKKHASLDEIQANKNPHDGSLLGVNDRVGIFMFVN